MKRSRGQHEGGELDIICVLAQAVRLIGRSMAYQRDAGLTVRLSRYCSSEQRQSGISAGRPC